MKKIRILVIEDNRLLREGIAAMLAGESDMKVTASPGNGENLEEILRAQPADLVLLDLGLRSRSSLTVVKLLRKKFPGTRVIVMDLVPTQEDVFEFVQAGVSGFILKDATVEEFLRTIRSVARGVEVLPPHLTGSLFSQIVAHAVQGSGRDSLLESVRMTKRERQVIGLIADGLTNKEIAQKLHLSTYTVKSHVHNILEKLAIHTRVQIAGYARERKEFMDAAAGISLLDE